MDQTTHRTSEIPVSEGNVYRGSAPLIGDSRVVMIGCPPTSFPTSVFVEGYDALKQEIGSIVQTAKALGYLPELPKSLSSEFPTGISFCHDPTTMAYFVRKDLKDTEKLFKGIYSYGGLMENRHCLTSLSNDLFSWAEKTSGIMWVGVHGLDATCVVTLSGHLDWKRVHGGLASTDAKTVLSLFRKSVLSELEDLADPSSERCKKWLHRSFDVPFCVVSSTPRTTETPAKSCHETSSNAGFATEAIDFVRYSGKLPMAKNRGDSILLAISAFLRLIQKKCEAKEIEVTVLSSEVPSVENLDISEIGDYLATIEETGMGLHSSPKSSTKHV